MIQESDWKGGWMLRIPRIGIATNCAIFQRYMHPPKKTQNLITDQTIQDQQYPEYLQANGYGSESELEVECSRRQQCRS